MTRMSRAVTRRARARRLATKFSNARYETPCPMRGWKFSSVLNDIYHRTITRINNRKSAKMSAAMQKEDQVSEVAGKVSLNS